MHFHDTFAIRGLLVGSLVLLACIEPDGNVPGATAPVDGGRSSPPAPQDCQPAPGEQAYWFEYLAGPDQDGIGPRMAEFVVRHPPGISPVVTGLEAARVSNKSLHVRAVGDGLTRVVLLATDNLTPLPAGPLACLRVPESVELSFVRSQSEFAPAMVEPDPEVIELWPAEVTR